MSLGAAPQGSPLTVEAGNAGASAGPQAGEGASRLQAQRFQTDVRRTRGLRAGQILLQRKFNASSIYDAVPDQASNAAARAASLKEEEQRLNKRIDEHVRLLESGLAELIQMFRVGDKSVARAEQESLTSEFRADQIVRATSGLAGLGRALQLSLLLSQGKDRALEEQREAQKLKEEIEEMKRKGGALLGELFTIGDGVNSLSPPQLPPPAPNVLTAADAAKALDALLTADATNELPASATLPIESHPAADLTAAMDGLTAADAASKLPMDRIPENPPDSPIEHEAIAIAASLSPATSSRAQAAQPSDGGVTMPARSSAITDEQQAPEDEGQTGTLGDEEDGVNDDEDGLYEDKDRINGIT